MFKPLGRRLLVRPVIEEDVTEGGVVIPAAQLTGGRAISGEIVDWGRQLQLFDPDADLTGVRVAYLEQQAFKIDLQGVEHHILDESYLIAYEGKDA